MEVKKELQKRYKNANEVYKDIKDELSKYAVIESTHKEIENKKTKSEVNSEVIRILSKAGIQDKDVGNVASIVANNYGRANKKQRIYSTIVAEYEQKRGLNIYNLIKNNV